MATALIGGLVSKGADAREFRVVEPLAAQHEKLVERFPGIGIFHEATAGAIDGADLVVMAVKPQHMHEAATALAPFIASVPVVLSIAAGTRIADLSRWLGGYPRIARAMPNTPALVGAGISGVFAPLDVERGRPQAGRPRTGSRGRGPLGGTRGDARCGDRRFRQRSGLRVLLPRSAGAGGARARFLERRCAQARLHDVRRRPQARAGVRSGARASCARKSRRRAAPRSARSR